MKKHDLTLDFTSLLDVVMILLFFFVLFSTVETQKSQSQDEWNFDDVNIISFQLTDIKSTDDWKMNIFCADEHISTITSSESMLDQMSNLFTILNIGEEDGVIGIFSYNGGVDYTIEVVRSIRIAMNEFKKIHEQFYFSEINTSR